MSNNPYCLNPRNPRINNIKDLPAPAVNAEEEGVGENRPVIEPYYCVSILTVNPIPLSNKLATLF